MLWWLLAQAATPAAPAQSPPAAPVVAPDQAMSAVGLALGESMIVRVAADGTVALVDGHPGDRKAAAGEIRIDLRRANEGTMLIVSNASPRFLLYRAAIARSGTDRPQSTTICPVLPDGKFGIETWPYALARMILYGFRYDDHPAMTCR